MANSNHLNYDNTWWFAYYCSRLGNCSIYIHCVLGYVYFRYIQVYLCIFKYILFTSPGGSKPPFASPRQNGGGKQTSLCFPAVKRGWEENPPLLPCSKTGVGSNLQPFYDHFGSLLGAKISFGGILGASWKSWEHLGTTLRQFWSNFEPLGKKNH